MATYTITMTNGATIVVDQADYQTVVSGTQEAVSNPSVALAFVTVTPPSGFPISIRIGDVSTLQELT
jgi:hypothetical protein